MVNIVPRVRHWTGTWYAGRVADVGDNRSSAGYNDTNDLLPRRLLHPATLRRAAHTVCLAVRGTY